MDKGQESRIQGEKRCWDISASGYDRFILSRMAEGYGKLLSRVAGEIKPTDVVLDVATGTGLVAFEVAKRAEKVYGVDISPKMLAKAAEKAKADSVGNIEFRLEDGYATSFDDGVFDVVICSNALHMMSDPPSALAEMRRVLKLDGALVAPTYCHAESTTLRTTMGLSLVKAMRWMKILPYLHRFKREDILRIVEAAGFAIVQEEELDKDPLFLYIKARKTGHQLNIAPTIG